MKLNRIRWMLILLFMAIPLMMSAQYGIVLNEDFDDLETPLPDGWTQESVSGQQLWTLETGGVYPTGDVTGGKRIALRNETRETSGFVTRLVTPTIDLSNVVDPILCLAHAQAQWSGDFDILRIYYRIDQTSKWRLLKEYSDMYIPHWQKDTLSLGVVSAKEYQLAFEGTDRLGRGIVIDDIVVRSHPACMSPDPVTVTEVDNSSASIFFNFAFDALEARVVVATEALNVEQLNADNNASVVYDKAVFDSKVEVDALLSNTKYYVYIRQTCLSEESLWSTEVSFTTKSVTALPYHEKFNFATGSAQKQRLVKWSYYNEFGEFVPYINSNSQAYNLYRYSPDSTTALVFSSENDIDQPIEAGNKVYAITPQLDVDDISKCQVSFVGTYYADALRQSGRRLKVGVMDDPVNLQSFVEVETVELTSFRKFEHFIISLEEYKGTGRYVALVSDFDEPNVFYLDNFKVERLPDCRTPQNININIESSSSIKFSWNSYGSTKGDVLVSETLIDTSKIDLSTAQLKADNVDITGSVPVSGLLPEKDYWYSVRNRCGEESSEWSNPQRFRTPGVISQLPHFINFEDVNTYEPRPISGIRKYKLPTNLLTIDNMGDCASAIFDEVKTDIGYLPQRSSKRLELVATTSSYSYVVFPEISDVNEYAVSFWYGAYLTNEVGISFEVGTMTNASNIQSFTTLATLTTEETWQKASFKINTGGYFALKIVSPNGAADAVHAYIDDVAFSEPIDCKEPKSVVVVPTQFTAAVSWTANGGSKWNVRVTKTELSTDSLESETFSDYAFISDNIEQNNTTITSLLPKNTTYYVYVGTVCADGSCVWTGATKFMTECPAFEELPYSMDFDGYATGDRPAFSVPCVYTDVKYNESSFSYIPQLANTPSVSGNALLLNYKSYSFKYDLYVALPLMNPNTNLSDLQLNMQVYPYYTDRQLVIGVMSDPTDLNTFEEVSTFSFSTEKKWEEVIATFPNRNTANLHIAIRTQHPFAIDNIIVKQKDYCYKVQKPEARNITDNSAEVRWIADSEKNWDLLVSKKTIAYGDLSTVFANPTADVVFNQTVTTNPYKVSNLTPSTTYNVYVRANCGNESTGEWANDCATFTTSCVSLKVGDGSLETFDNCGIGLGKAPFCWSVASGASIQVGEYIPHCVDNYAHSGSGSLFFHTTSTFNDGYAIVTEIDTVDYEDISHLQVSFYGTCGQYALPQYECKLIVGIVSSPGEWGTFIPIDTITGYAQEQCYTIPFSTYRGAVDGSKGAYIAFRSNFRKDNYFYIDDVRIDRIPDCPAPRNVSIDDTAAGSVSASWTGGTAPFKVVVSDRAITIDDLNGLTTSADGVVVSNTNNRTINVGSLEANNYYYLYVQSGCNNGLGGWTNAVRFKNNDCQQSVSLPYTDDFNSNLMTGIAVNPDCWTSYYNGVSVGATYPYVDIEGRSGKSVILETRAATDKLLMISPELSTTDLSQCQATFYISGVDGYQRSIVIGTLSDISNEDAAWNTFHPIDTILCNTSSWTKCEISLAKINKDDKYVAFSTVYSLNYEDNVYGRRIVIDDVDIDVVPTCYRPDNVTVTKRNATSVSVSFDELGFATSWDLQYGAKGFALGSGTIVNLNNTEYTIENLSAQTEYDVYVRSHCGSVNDSRWTSPIVVSTTPQPMSCSTSVIIDFEDNLDNEQWFLTNNGQTNKWAIGSACANGDAGNAMYISNDNGASATYDITSASVSWAYRYVTLHAGVYTFSYDWNCFGEAGKKATDPNVDYMKIALIPSTAEFNGGKAYLRLADGEKYQVNSASDSHTIPYLSLIPKGVTSLCSSNGWTTSSYTYVVDETFEGTYILALMWNNNNTTGTKPTPSAVVDNIAIDYNPCVFPVDIHLDNLTANGGTLSWHAIGTPESYDVVVMDTNISPDDAEAAQHKAFERTNYTNTNVEIIELNSGTFYAYIRQNCSTTSHSQWSEPIMFATPCGEFYTGDNGYTFDFDDVEEHTSFNGSAENFNQSCFVLGSQRDGVSDVNGYITVKRNPWLMGKIQTGVSARSGEYSLTYNCGKSELLGGYVALPPIYGNLDTMQVTFWMRPHNATTAGKISSMYLDRSKNAMTITVGTMTNPYDASTFDKIDNITYPYSGRDLVVTNDPSGEEYWVKCTVPLGARTNSGNYIAFLCDTAYGIANDICIDDIKVESAMRCGSPFDLKIDKVGDTDVQISYTYSGNADDKKSFEVHIASTLSTSDTIQLDTIVGGVANISDLTPCTDYYVRVRQLCQDNMTSDWSQVAKFRTNYGIRYLEQYSDMEIFMPTDWTVASHSAEANVDALLSSGNLYGNSNKPGKDGWMLTDLSGLSGGHIICKARPSYPFPNSLYIRNYNAYWLFSPTIYLSGKNAHLTFDLAATIADGNKPMSDIEKGHAESAFIVALAEEGSAAWHKLAVWDNKGSGDYVFDNITGSGTNVRLDLSEYVGKSVRIALFTRYYRPDVTNDVVAIDMHVDNFRINSFVKNNMTDEICQAEDYFENGFDILSREIDEKSENNAASFSRVVLQPNVVAANIPDTVHILDLTINPVKEHYISDYVCAGKIYNNYGFDSKTVAQIYKRKVSTDIGCDSIAILDLKVVDIPNVVEYDTICQGGNIVWNGKTYTEQGVYTDTLTMSGCTCDSIVTLALYVKGSLSTTDEVTICFGDSIMIGTLGLVSESGHYLDTIHLASGCDSIISVNLTVNPEFVTVIDTVLCLGELYEDDAFIGGYDETGVYTIQTKSSGGCDSTITLNLIVIDPYNPVEVSYNISREELPYTVFGETFDVNTPDGANKRTLEVSNERCSGTLEITLYVNYGNAVDNVNHSGLLVLTPNPINVGDKVTAHLDLNAEQRNGLSVQVYNTSGSLIQSFLSNDEHIVIGKFHQAGVFIVRIVDGIGVVYQGKVVVR